MAKVDPVKRLIRDGGDQMSPNVRKELMNQLLGKLEDSRISIYLFLILNGSIPFLILNFSWSTK